MQTTIMNRLVSLEYLFAAVFTAIFFVTVGNFDWWWLVALFLLFDISMAGYLVSSRVGAIIYNIGHSIIGPTILAALYIITDEKSLLFLLLLWLFHIFVDRALGFGMKHTNGFHHTHLGKNRKSKR